MQPDFVFLGPLHLAILAAIPVAVSILIVLVKKSPTLRRPVCRGLAGILLTTELLYYAYLVLFDPPATLNGLPLQLCNVTLWVTVFALLTRKQPLVDGAWYLGAFGPTIGILIPQLWAPSGSFPTIQFFIGHAGVIVSISFLALSGEARPSAKGAASAFLALNAIGIGLGTLNAVLGTNYMFLRTPPATPEILQFVTPPLHVVLGEATAAAFFCCLALPFRARRVEKAPPREAAILANCGARPVSKWFSWGNSWARLASPCCAPINTSVGRTSKELKHVR